MCTRPLAGSQELARTRSRSVSSAASLHARLQGSEAGNLPLQWRQSVEDSDVPTCALFDHPCPVGPAPGARWGHASVAVGDRLFLFGGDGASMFSDGFVYDSGEYPPSFCVHHAIARSASTAGAKELFVCCHHSAHTTHSQNMQAPIRCSG